MVTVSSTIPVAALDAPATRRCLRRRRTGCAAIAAAAGVLGWLTTLASPVPWLVPAFFTAVLAGIAVDMAVRLRRTTAVLTTNPWVEVDSKVRQVPFGPGASSAITMLELRGAPDDGVVLVTSAGVRARPMDDLTPRTWVAGDDRRFYLAAPGGAPVVRAKRLRLRSTAGDVGDVRTPLHSRLRPGR